MTPRQLGPMSRILPLIVEAIWRSSSLPDSPTSLKPAEITMAEGTPAATASWMIPGTVAAGVVTTIRSGMPGSSAMLL